MKHEVIFEKGYRSRLRSTLYRRCHYLAVSACTFTAVLRSTQPSTLRGTVKWVSAYGLSNNVDDSCQFSADSQAKSTGLVWAHR